MLSIPAFYEGASTVQVRQTASSLITFCASCIEALLTQGKPLHFFLLFKLLFVFARTCETCPCLIYLVPHMPLGVFVTLTLHWFKTAKILKDLVFFNIFLFEFCSSFKMLSHFRCEVNQSIFESKPFASHSACCTPVLRFSIQ